MTEKAAIIDWIDKKGNSISDNSQFPEDTLGFVYCITNLVTGKKYIGKKLLWTKKISQKTVILKNGQKKVKKTSIPIPSDWRTYYGSSAKVVEDVKKYGTENYKREILVLCQSKGSLSYEEAKMQFQLEVLEKQDEYYNGIVNCRVNVKHLKSVLAFNEI